MSDGQTDAAKEKAEFEREYIYKKKAAPRPYSKIYKELKSVRVKEAKLTDELIAHAGYVSGDIRTND